MNNQIFLILYNLSHQTIFADYIFIFLAKYFPYIVILVAIVFLLFHHDVILSKNPFKAFALRWKEIVLVFFSGICADLIAIIIKIILKTPRPFLVYPDINPLLSKTDFSFPSGHATFFMAIAIALFFSHKKVGYLFMFFALLIGITRIITGVHFPIDIVGGFILGTIIAYLVRFLYNKIN